MSFSGRDRKLFILALIVFGLVGSFLVRSSCGSPAVGWLSIFKASDFDSPEKVIEYVRNLRVPIPVLVSLTEIANYNLTGNTFLVTRYFYRIAMVLSFILAIYLASSSRRKVIFSFGLSFVFLWCTVLVHPGNPQPYDVFFALFSQLYIFFLRLAVSPQYLRDSPRTLALICFASGFFLTMTELTRPFVWLILPLFLIGGYQVLKVHPKRYFLVFLLPVLFFSGGWHSFIFWQHGQITWTNHSGFNLANAWPMVEIPVGVREPKQPLAPSRWENLNTAEHGENSRRILRAVLDYWVTHPKEAFFYVLLRIGSLLVVETRVREYKPNSLMFSVYRPLVWITSIWLVVQFFSLVAGFAKFRLRVMTVPENILILMAVLYVFVLAVGERGEEARFIVSLLPFLAILPCYCAPTGPEAVSVNRKEGDPL